MTTSSLVSCLQFCVCPGPMGLAGREILLKCQVHPVILLQGPPPAPPPRDLIRLKHLILGDSVRLCCGPAEYGPCSSPVPPSPCFGPILTHQAIWQHILGLKIFPTLEEIILHIEKGLMCKGGHYSHLYNYQLEPKCSVKEEKVWHIYKI